ncbi:MAG: gamma-glutamylcyclotransferase [Gammaproteobacteria bacterium]|nr:hypothetical protein [Gammaproteobacteria bacterium]NIN62484.1 hypothetical protein [Gammaproteobacteria bacterium]NIO62867.1 hypothetical protein [Gammaproteobacteria bacterium]NIP49959.1 gamma-glutamylcyclotransferase [Gammaproteobacteria bacterium]NIQ12178.1 gamma-glutamylcyclotransferase [Gammaproteobacteria bacterium]
MQSITGKVFEANYGLLENHARYVIKNKVFPGIIPEPGSIVKGVIYHGIDPISLQYLDAFEDDLYERQTLLIFDKLGNELTAEVYIVNNKYRRLLAGKAWDLDTFRRSHLGPYLASCRRFHNSMSREIHGT